MWRGPRPHEGNLRTQHSSPIHRSHAVKRPKFARVAFRGQNSASSGQTAERPCVRTGTPARTYLGFGGGNAPTRMPIVGRAGASSDDQVCEPRAALTGTRRANASRSTAVKCRCLLTSRQKRDGRESIHDLFDRLRHPPVSFQGSLVSVSWMARWSGHVLSLRGPCAPVRRAQLSQHRRDRRQLRIHVCR